MENKSDGGPAFPQTNEQRYADPVHGVIRPSDISGEAHPGMTLRDYFAAKALPVVFAEFMRPTSAWDDYDDVAKSCYRISDAMIRARTAQSPADTQAAHLSEFGGGK